MEYEMPPTGKLQKIIDSRLYGNDVVLDKRKQEKDNCTVDDNTKVEINSGKEGKTAGEIIATSTGTSTDTQPADSKLKKTLVARPFTMMRGHTAFLTFATAGNKLQPFPN